MGAQLSLLAQSSPSIGIFSYIDVLEDVHYVSLLNSSRFLKTCKALDSDGEIIIKVFIKPTDDYEITNVLDAIKEESLLLSQLPNVLNYSKIVESNRAGYLIRQHLRRNLYDRLSSRPYLQDIELRFVAFQLLQVLKDVHKLDIVHTDIKTENILVNSWNWITLTDFASHIKPIYLPEDNPGEFSFYFDTSKRRNCYIAPERFNSKLYNNSKKQYKPSKEMDIFSLGCCIAELFSEGIPIFNLSQLYKYKTKEYDANEYLNEHFPDNEPLKNMIVDMIHLDPQQRLSIPQILEKYRGIFFPDYFYNFTYDYFRTLSSLGTSIPSTGSLTAHSSLEDRVAIFDESLQKVYREFPKICSSLGFPNANNTSVKPKLTTRTNFFFKESIHIGGSEILSLQKFENYKDNNVVQDECALLFISYLSRIFRNLTQNDSKIKCLELLTAFSQFVSDDNKIDRVIPYLETCFEDPNAMIQALGIQSMCQVLSTVENINHLNENIFVDYLLPRIKKLLYRNKDQPYVRMIMANTLGNFVNLACKFREISLTSHYITNKLETDEDIQINNRYTLKLLQLIEDISISLLTDNDVWVKISLLNNILTLCKFFGKEKTNDIILSHLITYLNDRNPMLRMTLVESISGIAILLGPITLEQYVLPLLIQTLTDSEELVVIATLQTLKDLCKTGLVNKKNSFDVAREITPLLLHPNYAIRQFTLLIVFEISQKLSKPELYCNLYPIIRPYFGFDVEFTLDMMVDTCKQPISRTVYNLLCSWSLRASNSLFWKQVPSKDTDSFGISNISFIGKDYIPKNYGFTNSKSNKNKQHEAANSFANLFDNTEVPLTTEDKIWIDKFKTSGLQDPDLWKLLILRSYVLRTTKISSRKSELNLRSQNSDSDRKYTANINLTNIMPRNIFFDIEFTKNVEDQLFESSPVYIISNIEESPKGINNTLPKVVDMHGSLMFSAKPSATTTQNLRNVYVQLEPNKIHSQIHNDLITSDNGLPIIPAYAVSNSYEEDVDTIIKFLNNLDITPNLRDYKEFGLITNIPTASDRYLANIKGKLVASLFTNIRNLVVSTCVSLDTRNPFLVSGSLQGIISVWNIKNVVNGKSYDPELTFECNATINDIIMLTGYNTFVVSTSDMKIRFYRILWYDQIQDGRKSTYIREIRNINLGQEIDEDKPVGSPKRGEFVTKLREFLTEDKSLLLCLTNYSRIIIIDFRTMKIANNITNPVSHGGISTFTVSGDNSSLIIGTTKSIIDIWDLRFNVLTNSWSFGECYPITDIELIPKLGKNMMLVVGGSSDDTISIWDFAKVQCRQVISICETEPIIEKFQPIFNRLDNLIFDSKRVNQRFSSVAVRGTAIVISDSLTNVLIMINLSNFAQSKVLFGPNKKLYTFSPIQVTTNMTFLMVRGKSRTAEENHSSNITGNIVNTLTIATLQNNSYVITSDNLGIINIYQ